MFILIKPNLYKIFDCFKEKETITFSHCLYRFLDGQKRAASNLAFQAFEGYNKTKISSCTKRGFSKKGLARIDFFVLGSYESLKGLEC